MGLLGSERALKFETSTLRITVAFVPLKHRKGPNIGLITSLATYARINQFGFIEAPFRKVRKGRLADEVEFLSPLDGDQYVIAQANSKVDGSGRLVSETVTAREAGEFVITTPDKVDYLDVSPKAGGECGDGLGSHFWSMMMLTERLWVRICSDKLCHW